MRDAAQGINRFDELQKSLGIAPNMLTRRLKGLVESGMLERKPYSTKPLRYEYVLTKIGYEFQPVLIAMLAWGNKHFVSEGASVNLIDRETRKRVEPILVDAKTGKRISANDHMLVAGPAADTVVKQRMKFYEARRLDPTLRPDFLYSNAN